uniref:flagellar protein FlaG n=1 Tax=Agathobacter sp. TaxID=2021311 RepID=UPI004055CF11
MGIEGIKSMAAMSSYQGSTRTTEAGTASKMQTDTVDTTATSTQLAQETMAMNTKETGAETGGEGNPANPEAQQSAIKKAVEEINKKAKNSEAIFGVHEKTNRVTIKIVDKQTKELIKEFPPEKTLDMIARVWEMAGLMVDEKR